MPKIRTEANLVDTINQKDQSLSLNIKRNTTTDTKQFCKQVYTNSVRLKC